MELVKVYIAHGDGGERRVGPVIGLSKLKSEAEKLAKGKGFYGSDGSVFEGHGIQVEDGRIYLLRTQDLFEDGVLLRETADRAKQTALAKLTDDDLRALGLTRG